MHKAIGNDLQLMTQGGRLTLVDQSSNPTASIVVDFLTAKQRYRRQHTSLNNELLAKALVLKTAIKHHWQILDATAGFGNDAYLIASLGAQVTMLERSAIMAKLLADGLKRAQSEIKINHLALKLIHDDAHAYFTKLLTKANPNTYPQVIYLDPMYPPRKKSALNKQDLRLLAKIVGHDEDADQLLPLALKIAQNRVVVKRPKLAPFLANHKPSLIMSGSSIRFDIYF